MDEPSALFEILARYERALLGVLLVEPRRAFGREVSRINPEDCLSELLGDVLRTLRDRPAISGRDLLEATAKGRGVAWEILEALEGTLPYNAEFYAAQLRRLYRDRRRFWRILKKAYSAQFELMREISAPRRRRRLIGKPARPSKRGSG